MSLLTTIAAGVETAFTAAQDLVSDGVYTVRTAAPVYDPVTDDYTASTTTFDPVRMLRTSMTDQEREASALTVTDVKVLIPATDLPGVRPGETDVFTLDGTGYNVITIKTVPGNSLWIVFAREK
jgi:hypothetical protein